MITFNHKFGHLKGFTGKFWTFRPVYMKWASTKKQSQKILPPPSWLLPRCRCRLLFFSPSRHCSRFFSKVKTNPVFPFYFLFFTPSPSLPLNFFILFYQFICHRPYQSATTRDCFFFFLFFFKTCDCFY